MIIGKKLKAGLFLSLITLFSLQATPPSTYYVNAVGKSNSALMSALNAIVSDCGSVAYKSLPSVYVTSDIRDNGEVWDMYSSISHYTYSSTGTNKAEGTGWNKEHSVPQSWFSGDSPMYSDAWHVVPTDCYINNMRSNYPFGETTSPTRTSSGGFSKLGSCSTTGYSGTVFEPNDQYKGDFARMYFFMATRYENRITNWGGIFVSTYPHIVKWQLDMLLRWHRQDPVSDKELKRNEAIYKSPQRNRNPYIDYPQLVELIFGNQQGRPFTMEELPACYISAPTDNTPLDFGTIPAGTIANKRFTVQGVGLTAPVKLTITGGEASAFALSATEVSTSSTTGAGTEITVTFTPTPTIVHYAATLTLTSIGAGSVTLPLTGNVVNGFSATTATQITTNSFIANWTALVGATDYELSVSTLQGNGGENMTTLLDCQFRNAQDQIGWTLETYNNYEPEGLRLASGGSNGSATTPALDLTGENVLLTVISKPYKTDASTLYIALDGKEIGSYTYKGIEPQKATFQINGAAKNAKITLSALQGKRLFLQSATITKGTQGVEIPLIGYPKRVGNNLSYTVTGLTEKSNYNYTVTPFIGTTQGEQSNTIAVTTAQSSSVPELTPESDILVYALNNEIAIINAPLGSFIKAITLDGRIAAQATVQQEESYLTGLQQGVYIIAITTPNGVISKKVLL